MAHRANKRPPGRIKSSIVARLNTRLFFRLLGIYFTMDLLLLFLFCGGLFVWSEQQAAQISTLVEERGVPSADTIPWMEASDYTIIPLREMPSFSEETAAGYSLFPIPFLPQYPELEGILEELTGKISTEQMAEMTYQVDVLGRTVDDVARKFLVSQGLLSA